MSPTRTSPEPAGAAATVAVVGAGIVGLSCAWLLQRQPIATTRAFLGEQVGALATRVGQMHARLMRLDALGKRSIHVVGPISRALLHPGLTAQHLVTQALGVAMRTFGRRVRAPRDLPAA